MAEFRVNPFFLLDRVQAHFNAYIARLKTPAETTLRANFEAEWDRRMAAELIHCS